MLADHFRLVKRSEILSGSGFDHYIVSGVHIAYYVFKKDKKYSPDIIKDSIYAFLIPNIREKIKGTIDDDDEAYQILTSKLISDYASRKDKPMSKYIYYLSGMEFFYKILDTKFMSDSNFSDLDRTPHAKINIVNLLVIAKRYLVKASIFKNDFIWLVWNGEQIAPLGSSLRERLYTIEDPLMAPKSLGFFLDLWEEAGEFTARLEDLQQMDNFNNLLSPRYKKILEEVHPIIEKVDKGTPLPYIFMEQKYKHGGPWSIPVEIIKEVSTDQLMIAILSSEIIPVKNVMDNELFNEYIKWLKNLFLGTHREMPKDKSSLEYKEWSKENLIESEKLKCGYLGRLIRENGIKNPQDFDLYFDIDKDTIGYKIYKKRIMLPIYPIYKKENE